MILDGTGAVLAGGQSRRFGSDKARAPWRGGMLVEAAAAAVSSVFPQTLIVVKRASDFESLTRPGLRIVRDLRAEQHPLAGVAASLAHATTPYVFVCACDMPLLQPALIERLWRLRPGWEAVVPVFDGVPQPLCAVYARDCGWAVARLLERPGAGVRDLLPLVRARLHEVPAADPYGSSFVDLDTRADFERALRGSGC